MSLDDQAPFILRHPREMGVEEAEQAFSESHETPGLEELPYACPAPGCAKVYGCYGSLYQHKRAHHPELMALTLAGRPAGRGRPPLNNLPEPTHACPAIGCDKTYGSACGLYQHKRAHHPELINRRNSTALGQFACPSCEKVYTCYGSLYQHKRAHHPEHNAPLDGHGVAKRARSEQTQGHQQPELELHFECEKCDKAYASADALLQHRQVHHSEMFGHDR